MSPHFNLAPSDVQPGPTKKGVANPYTQKKQHMSDYTFADDFDEDHDSTKTLQ